MGKVKSIKKAVIFAGGKGTRMSEYTQDMPKPLVTVGPNPLILWVMKSFYRQGVRDFYILVGYKSDEFKTFFRDYTMRGRDVIITKFGVHVEDSCEDAEDWNVHIIETGEDTMTGARLAYMKNKKYLNEGEPFWLTYGDSLSDVDLEAVEKLHFEDPEDDHLITFTGINNSERFGILTVDTNGKVESFAEKSADSHALINGGYLAVDYRLLDYVNKDSGDLSRTVLTEISNSDLARCYHHTGFWHACDSKRDRDELEALYESNPELFG